MKRDAAADLVGCREDEVAVEAEQVASHRRRVHELAAEDDRADRVEAEVERRDDAEVPASSTETPEQISVLLFGRDDLATVGGDDFGLDEVVAGETELALEPPAAATEGETADAGVRHAAAGDGEAVLLGGGVDLSPPRPALDARDRLIGIDVDAVHGAKVDADAGVDDRRARDAVAAAVDGQRHALLTSDVDGGDNIICAGATGDERGLAVDHPVEHRAGVVVPGVARFDELTTESGNLEACRADVSHACPLFASPGSSERSQYSTPAAIQDHALSRHRLSHSSAGSKVRLRECRP